MTWDFSKESDLIDAAAGIISNVGARNGQGWEAQHPEWQDAASEWMLSGVRLQEVTLDRAVIRNSFLTSVRIGDSDRSPIAASTATAPMSGTTKTWRAGVNHRP